MSDLAEYRCVCNLCGKRSRASLRGSLAANAVARSAGWVDLTNYYGTWGHACPECAKRYGGDEVRLKEAVLASI